MTTPITFHDCQDLWGSFEDTLAEAASIGAQVSRFLLIGTEIFKDQGPEGLEFWSIVQLTLFVQDRGIPFRFTLRQMLDECAHANADAIGQAAKHRDAIIKQAKAAGFVVLEGGELC